MKKKQKVGIGITIAVILTLSISAAVIVSMRPTWLVQLVADQQLSSRNRYPEIEDGLHALLLGTGSPLPDADRAGPSVMVIAGEKHFVVDAGVGATENIALSGISPGLIDAVFITHYHSDHIADLGEMMLQRWTVAAHNESLPVYGPVNVTQIVEGFNVAYQFDSTYRIEHHGDAVAPANGSGGVAFEFDIGNGTMASHVVYNDVSNGIEVTMFNVNHTPVYPAVGYKFEYKGRSLVVSGDTIYTENMELQATNADLLICEGLNPELVGLLEEQAEQGNLMGETIETIFHDIPDYHITPWDAARLADNANVEYLVFTHMIPAVQGSPIFGNLFLGNASEIFSGRIEIADDGLFISLPANSEIITTTNLLNDTEPLPASAVLLVSILVLVAMFVAGWWLTKKRRLKVQTVLAVFSILMAFLILTRVGALMTTGFDILTVAYFTIEAIMLTWAIMVLRQDDSPSSIFRRMATCWNTIRKKGKPEVI